MQQQIRNNVRSRVLEYATTKTPDSRLYLYSKNFFGYGLILTSILIGLFALSFFAETASISFNFWDFIGFSLSGFIWMWLPEMLAVSLLSLLTVYVGYKLLDLRNLPVKMITTSVGYIAVLSLFVLIPVTNVFAESSLYNAVTDNDYKRSVRDTYITEELDANQEYFGAVESFSCGLGNFNTVTINHGGITKGFGDPDSIICSTIEIGDLIWIEYNESQLVTKFEVV